MGKAFWLRCETKEFEHRSALTPTRAKELIDDQFTIYVERDKQRIFKDEEFEKVGCIMEPNNSWHTAPIHVPILGLKELPISNDGLKHTHIQFAHCYKHQAGWASLLDRFRRGGGTLYDLEFLTDPSGRRVAAFGYHAGFAGAAAGALALIARRKGEEMGPLKPYENETAMVEGIRAALEDRGDVKVLVMGALGRCGRGAVDLFHRIGLEDANILQWDLAETANGGPFDGILEVDIFINCIYLSSKIPPFLTFEQLQRDRRLSVVVDISCDTTNPNNPLPIYKTNTTFSMPIEVVDLGGQWPPLWVVSIDHLPTLLPREASEQFSSDLLPSLKQFPDRDTEPVWKNAKRLFDEKVVEAESVAHSTQRR